MESRDQIIKMQKTANTLYDLRDHSDVKFCKEIADFVIEKSGGAEETRISTENFRGLIVSRFMTNHQILELMARKYGKELQVIELGAGFTPHFLNLTSEIGKYIEIEFEENSKLKEEIIKKLTEKKNIYFVAGDILSKHVWKKVKEIVDPNKPVIIFSEGVVAQYFNDEQKELLASFLKDLLTFEGSCFVTDDTLRNHPELSNNPIIQEGMNRVGSVSGNDIYKSEKSSFQIGFDNWGKLFKNNLYTVDYVLSKPEMDFTTTTLKVTVCANDKNLALPLSELSKQNKLNRIWK